MGVCGAVNFTQCRGPRRAVRSELNFVDRLGPVAVDIADCSADRPQAEAVTGDPRDVLETAPSGQPFVPGSFIGDNRHAVMQVTDLLVRSTGQNGVGRTSIAIDVDTAPWRAAYVPSIGQVELMFTLSLVGFRLRRDGHTAGNPGHPVDRPDRGLKAASALRLSSAPPRLRHR